MKIRLKIAFLILILLFSFQSYVQAADGFVKLVKEHMFVDDAKEHDSNPDGEVRDLLMEDKPYDFYTDIDIEEFNTNSDMEDIILGQAALTLGFKSKGNIDKIKLGYDITSVEPGTGGIIYTWTVTMYDGSEDIWSTISNENYQSPGDPDDDTKRWGMDWEDISQLTGHLWKVYGIEPTNPVLKDKTTKVKFTFNTPTIDPKSKRAEYYKVNLRVTLESKFIVKIKQMEKDSIKLGAAGAVTGGITVLVPDGESTVECLFPVSFIMEREIVVDDNTKIGTPCGSTNIVWGDPGDPNDPREKDNHEFYFGTTGEHITKDVVVYVKDNNPNLDMNEVAVYCYYQIGPYESWRLWDYGGNSKGLTWYTTLYPSYRSKDNANDVHEGYVSTETHNFEKDFCDRDPTDDPTKAKLVASTKISNPSSIAGTENFQYSTMVGCIRDPGSKGKHRQHNIEDVKAELYHTDNGYDEDKEGHPIVSWRGKHPFRMSYKYSNVNGCTHTVPSGGDDPNLWAFMDNKNTCADYMCSYPTLDQATKKEYDWPGKMFFWVGPLRMKLNVQGHSKNASNGINIDYTSEDGTSGTMKFSGLGSAGRYTLDKKLVVLPNRYATSSTNLVQGDASQWSKGLYTWPHPDITINSYTYPQNNNGDMDWPSADKGELGGLLMFVRPVGPEGFIIDSFKAARDFSTKVASKFVGSDYGPDEQGCAINAIRVKDNDRPLFYVGINHPVGSRLPAPGTMSADLIQQQDLGQKWFRYKMGEYSEMRFYNDSPIFPVMSKINDYTDNAYVDINDSPKKSWFEVFPDLKGKHPILPKHLHNIFVDGKDNYFETIWKNIVTKVEGKPGVPPTHLLLDYHLPFPNGVGLYTDSGSRLFYEYAAPPSGQKNMYAEAAGKKFHKDFSPFDTSAFDTKYVGTTNWKTYKRKFALRVGVRHAFHVVLFDNLNNIHYTGKNDFDTNFFKFDADNKLLEGVYHRVLWMYSHLYEGEFDGHFSFEGTQKNRYSNTKQSANETKGLFQNFNIRLNNTPFKYANALVDFEERENASSVYARIYDISESPGYNDLRYKEFRPEDFSYFENNKADFVFHHIFKHKSDAQHRYLLEVYGQDSDGNARFLFMKLDVLDYKSTGIHTIGGEKSSGKQ